MSNVITDSRYFQFPYDALPAIPQLTAAALKLLIVVLAEAQQKSTPAVKMSTADVLQQTGLNKGTIKTARDHLQRVNLVQSTEMPQARLWLFELLNPTTGKKRPGAQEFKSLRHLPPDTILKYFRSHLESYQAEPNGPFSMKARCPFHVGGKPSDRPLVATAGANGGVWVCHQCRKAGTLLDFEIAVASNKKENIDRKEAYKRVLAICRKGEKASPFDTDPLLGEAEEPILA